MCFYCSVWPQPVKLQDVPQSESNKLYKKKKWKGFEIISSTIQIQSISEKLVEQSLFFEMFRFQ